MIGCCVIDAAVCEQTAGQQLLESCDSATPTHAHTPHTPHRDFVQQYCTSFLGWHHKIRYLIISPVQSSERLPSSSRIHLTAMSIEERVESLEKRVERLENKMEEPLNRVLRDLKAKEVTQCPSIIYYVFII